MGGILVNSKSGPANIAYLRGRADEGVNSAKESVENLSAAVNSASARGVKAIRHQTENINAAVEAGKDAYREARQTTP